MQHVSRSVFSPFMHHASFKGKKKKKERTKERKEKGDPLD